MIPFIILSEMKKKQRWRSDALSIGIPVKGPEQYRVQGVFLVPHRIDRSPRIDTIRPQRPNGTSYHTIEERRAPSSPHELSWDRSLTIT
jgi:hypothetical protein